MSVKPGDIVVLPQADHMGWPRLLVESVYSKAADGAAGGISPLIALCSWFDRNHQMHRGEFLADLLQVISRD